MLLLPSPHSQRLIPVAILSSLTLSCGKPEEKTAGKDPRVEISISGPKPPSDSSTAQSDQGTFPASGSAGAVDPASNQNNSSSTSGSADGQGNPQNTPPTPDNSAGNANSGSGQSPVPAPSQPTAPSPRRATLTIAVNNLRTTQGNFCLSIFASPDGFPDSAEKAIFAECFTVLERTFSITLNDVPAGRYAVAGWHDENKDKQLNRNFLGIPREGLAFSENGKPRIAPPPGPPSFDSIAFEIGSVDRTTQMKTSYLLDLL